MWLNKPNPIIDIKIRKIIEHVEDKFVETDPKVIIIDRCNLRKACTILKYATAYYINKVQLTQNYLYVIRFLIKRCKFLTFT